MEEVYKLFIGKDCKVVLKIDNQTYIYTAFIIDYNSEKITFIDKYNNPYSYSTSLITELKLHKKEGQNDR